MSDVTELWTDNQDELRRAFIISHYGINPDFKVGSMLRDMEAIFQWLKNGKVPPKKTGGAIH